MASGPFHQVFPLDQTSSNATEHMRHWSCSKTLTKVFIHKSFLEKRFRAPLWFQYKAVTREHHAPKFCHACHAWKSPFHARYLFDNCHVFQSGITGVVNQPT